jgi:uncharacterized membrane protein YhhN
MLTILFIALAVLSAILHMRAEYYGPRSHVYIFKPLTMLFIILVALEDRTHGISFYKYMIVAGLLCSLAGDIFLMLPSDRFVAGLSSFLIAHLFYIAAFSSSTRADSAMSLLAALPFLLYGSVMLWILFPHLGRMKTPVLIYMLVILLMAWQALNSWMTNMQPGTLLAFLGALLFVASDSLLALNRFRHPFRSAHLLILSTYFTAQCLIALSV